jgi:hypothetical protein
MGAVDRGGEGAADEVGDCVGSGRFGGGSDGVGPVTRVEGAARICNTGSPATGNGVAGANVAGPTEDGVAGEAGWSAVLSSGATTVIGVSVSSEGIEPGVNARLAGWSGDEASRPVRVSSAPLRDVLSGAAAPGGGMVSAEGDADSSPVVGGSGEEKPCVAADGAADA